jgi:hypothetical protein
MSNPRVPCSCCLHEFLSRRKAQIVKIATVTLLALSAGVCHGELLPVKSVSASSIWGNLDPARTFDGSGIYGFINSELIAMNAGHLADAGAEGMWHSDIVEAPGISLTWELESPSSLRTIYYWNHNQTNLTDRGIQVADIEISTDGGSGFQHVGNFVFQRASGTSNALAEALDLGATHQGVTHIRLIVISNYGGNVTGLSEIRFSDLEPVKPTIARVATSSASSVYSGKPATALIDGSGLNGSLASGPDLAIASHGNEPSAAGMWHSEQVDPASIELEWEFVEPFDIRTIYYWNHNQLDLTDRGIREVEVQLSTDWGITYQSLGIKTLEQASGSAAEWPNLLDLEAQHIGVTNVRFLVISNYGSDYTGFSEIRFSADPQPAPSEFIRVQAVSASSNWGNLSPNRLIDSSGISGSLATVESALLALHGFSNNAFGMWHSEAVPADSVVLDWRFSTPASLRSMIYWNHNQNMVTDRGIQDAEIFVSTDFGASYVSLGTYRLERASGIAPEAPYVLNLPETVEGVTNVKFAVISNYGSAYTGFSEIRFLSKALTRSSSSLALLAQNISFSPNQVLLTWASDPTKIYRIAVSSDLIEWTPLLDHSVAGAPNASETTVVAPFAEGERWFFRVEEEP